MCYNKRNKNKKREVDVKMSKGAKIGLGIGGAVLALIAGVVMWLRKERKLLRFFIQMM